ncbi:hypothetical protein GCM10009841_22850 [Microlunatus panaciterrae]|uniref:UDP-N-acetylmuramyl pentapeptide phosphotransferase/UDP-N-acetylglucosamine-1-phosphate transferase n=1 Tax=Microlunatus panaciterrae TaxID=400768 RepID=A0ABS2RF50_9ACTN|nr:DUF6458 family protein [Microlunatus panaciterrae]MBM7797167.1 UDP-N-acetylmuramyl pentapeptide phosphotransferase/UDP-N-acetylglucosamine-1-phosphate transferase [Microlunatus panaciterrae]
MYGIGLGVFLGIIGAILLFHAIDFPDSWPIDESVLGWIFLIAGIVVIVLGLIQHTQRTRTKHTTERRVDVEGNVPPTQPPAV